MSQPLALRGNVDVLLTRYPSLAVKEMENEPTWWWLSFSGDGKCLGVVIVFAHGLLEAVRICKEQNINPGGEVLGATMPAELVPPQEYRNKILTVEEVTEFMPRAETILVNKDNSVEPWPPTAVGEGGMVTANPLTPDLQGNGRKAMIITLPSYAKNASEHNAKYSAAVDGDLTAVFGEQPLPPRPQLLCSKCEFQNDNYERLAEHFIEIHGYTIPAAWFEAGQENERLYPRLVAPSGHFTVVGVNMASSRGKIIANCSSLQDAIGVANGNSGLFPEVFVQNDSGREVYTVAPQSDRPRSMKSTHIPGGVTVLQAENSADRRKIVQMVSEGKVDAGMDVREFGRMERQEETTNE